MAASPAECIEAGLLDPDDAAAALARVLSHTDIAVAAPAEFVFEAVLEDMELKRDVFARLDRLCGPDAVLASASGHPASALDAGVGLKARVVAAHFWYPPQLLPLVEVCGSPRTDPDVVRCLCAMLAGAGKEPVVIDRELPGFIGNRIQFAALREAWSLWAAGYASAAAIDRVVRYSIGRRLGVTGPIESADLGGLDTIVRFARFLQPDLDATAVPPDAVAALAAAGRTVRAWPDGAADRLRTARRQELMRWLRADRDRATE